MMAYRGRKGDALALVIQWLKDKNIRQMHTAIKRVIQDKHIAGVNVTCEALHHDCEGGRYGS